MTKRIGLWSCGVLVIVIEGLGCGDKGPREMGDELFQSAIVNGATVTSASPPANPGTVAVYAQNVLKCSGTLIRRQWVLTAKKCVTNSQGALLSPASLTVVRSLNPGASAPPTTYAIDLIVPHDTRDLALIRVSVVPNQGSPMFDPAALSDKALPSFGTTLKTMGYGCISGGNGNGSCVNSGSLRTADLSVTGTNATAGTINTGMNASGQMISDGDFGGPAYTMFDASTRALPGVAAVSSSRVGNTATSAAVESNRRWIINSALTQGNMRGGAIRQADIALMGGANWTTVRTLHTDMAEDAPSFFVTTQASPTNIPDLAKLAEVKAFSGDFNGNRMADIVLFGGSGWQSVPIDWSPTFGDVVTNRVNPALASITQQLDAKIGTGDFDGDGKTDIVVMRGGSTVVNLFKADEDGGPGTEFFPQTTDLGASFGSNLGGGRMFIGDFNGDGRDDIAVVGNSSSQISTALSNGGATPTFFNRQSSSPVGDWANQPNASTVVGDWDGDGRDDIAVLGGNDSNDIRVAQSLGNGVFQTQTFTTTNFAGWARTTGVRVVSGDYNGDGRDDIALVGGQGWASVPIAFSQPPNFFETNNSTIFAAWAQEAGAIKVVSAHQADRRPPMTTMTVEPMESGNLVYLPLAPKQSGGSSQGQVNLDIFFQNPASTALIVDTVMVSFSGGPAVTPVVFSPALSVPANSSNRFLLAANQSILIPQPAPTTVTIQVQVRGFNSLLGMTAPLVAHVSPVATGAWSWPASSADLPAGQFWQGTGANHNPGGGQGFALDLEVQRFDFAASPPRWTNTVVGAPSPPTQNADYLSWGKPIYAMADGTVALVVDGIPTNTTLGISNTLCALTPSHPACSIPTWQDGNAFYIKSGTELMLYAHLQAGTLNPALPKNATVAKGTFLGLSGNSGNASNPHLHIHTRRDQGFNSQGAPQGPLRPMPIRDAFMIDKSLIMPPLFSAPWGFVAGKGVPEVDSLIWPSTAHPPGLATVVHATQSTTVIGGVPERAIDGNGNGDWYQNSVTHTDFQATPWWKADLDLVFFVAAVDIYNRTDCCADRLSNFHVDVSQTGTAWTTVATVAGQAPAQMSIPVNMNARYVRIQLSGTNNLSLAEVAIWVK